MAAVTVCSHGTCALPCLILPPTFLCISNFTEISICYSQSGQWPNQGCNFPLVCPRRSGAPSTAAFSSLVAANHAVLLLLAAKVTLILALFFLLAVLVDGVVLLLLVAVAGGL